MKEYDVIVIGAGHAGCEAALASARLGCKTMVLATNLDTVGFLACNPSIGGTAKGQIVKEIDALGGEMAINADKSLLQMRMLNRGKGPAVYSPRAQVDKNSYHVHMKQTLESTPNLYLRQGEAVSIQHTQDGNFIVKTAVDLAYVCKAVVVCCGVYLNSKTLVGQCVRESGPNGFANARYLSQSLVELGFTVKRFKTGTPARVRLTSLNLRKTVEQCGEEDVRPFSYLTDSIPATKRSCYLTYSTAETKRIILENKHLAPIYNGAINGVGPRYCPSIEDKVVRFADKERHQIFLEPESEDTCEYYVQGASSSMPASVQEQIYRSIEGLENVEIMRDAYAIEYDCIDATQLDATLMAKHLPGMFFAGQINGTSGYEEAAGQGIVAGINAERYVHGKPHFTLRRDNSYIGVLIDDITTKENVEPYRMMTSRAEHRLILRQDNADMRLTDLGREIGLVNDQRYSKFLRKKQQIESAQKQLNTVVSPKVYGPLFESKNEPVTGAGLTVDEMLRRTNISTKDIQALGFFADIDDDALYQIEIESKYRGYIEKEKEAIAQANKLENKPLPADIDYLSIDGLRLEARQKLHKIRPANLGQAGRILGVSPADIQILIVYLAQMKK
ncbi:MAG: tRNA uridine-5-carboxymethylaminomethyl(34) synthesis enzyme MnmG [Clostridiales bacterium]|nr:tRNA uridine-5-carboxymethylaminomethyl(34) synthesis enzyme MnmG [Clostridiales bacterium]